MYFGGKGPQVPEERKLGREGGGSGYFDCWPIEHGNGFISPTVCTLCPPTHFTYALLDTE